MAGASLESFEGTNEHDLSGDRNRMNALRSQQQSLDKAIKGNSSPAKILVLGPSMGDAKSSLQLGDLGHYLDYGNVPRYPTG